MGGCRRFEPGTRVRRGFIPALALVGEYHPGPEYFHRVSTPRGRDSLGFALSGFHLLFDGFSQEDSALLKARYGSFVSGTSPADAGRIRIVEAEVPGFLKPRMEGGVPELYRLEQSWSGSRLTAYAYEFAGWFDFEERRGQLAIAPVGGDPVHRGVENFLRVVCAHAFLRQGGLLLHAAGVVRGDRAHLFFGPSGSGKTTVTLLSERQTILGDDLVLIRAASGAFEACAVPFRGLYREPPETDRAFPLAGLYRLVKDRDDFLAPLPPSRGAAELLGSLPFVMESGEGARALGIAGRIVDATPVQRLHFRKSADFWRLIA